MCFILQQSRFHNYRSHHNPQRMKFLLAFAILPTVLTLVYGDKWNDYKIKYGKNYSGASDSQRKQLFLATDAKITKHNSQKNVTYKLGHNKFSDKTADEKASFLSIKPVIKYPTFVNRVMFSNGKRATGNVAQMQSAVQEYGAISVGITVVDSFYSYASGVYHDAACGYSPINHGVDVVGWGTLNGIDHWVVRNSWGSDWGRSGYILMQRGVNLCRIEEYSTGN